MHTPIAQATRTALKPRTQSHVVAHRASCRGCAWPCRRPCRSEHYPCRRPCRACTLPCRHPLRSRYKNCITTQNIYRAHCVPCRACRNVTAPCRRALLRRITAPGAPCCHARPAPPLTIQMIISRHTPLARPHAFARGPALSWATWLCRGRVVLSHASLLRCLLGPACHNTKHCIVTQHQNE